MVDKSKRRGLPTSVDDDGEIVAASELAAELRR
jgi:hypothetical protein